MCVCLRGGFPKWGYPKTLRSLRPPAAKRHSGTSGLTWLLIKTRGTPESFTPKIVKLFMDHKA